MSGTTIRERIDAVVAETCNQRGYSDRIRPKNIHYGAMEVNGTGIRYFGDITLVLRSAAVPAQTLVLLRNSYDLCCAPIVQRVYVRGKRKQTHANAVAELQDWAGDWPADARDMAVVKILEGLPERTRRLTTGMVSAGVLTDEDYIEVARKDGFRPADVEELRVSASDVAAEARIADRLRIGPLPSLAELQWRHRRRAVDREAAKVGLKVRTVVTAGRARS